ncbi:response regulator [Pseudoalteromonas luteoviolacea]|uniref:Chemotaxis protein CheY n=1 Tax=Pseudoalteromonas luteoviolacea H33 TaxID=1365251 RepID=A0A167G4W4_9GAMM|nr:response regulator [Pseudoalteromonas luteoviolacea]KZN54108.1 chemotaxis protein CheY [Pseudoalteromonas luteoviolacea H33]KZN78361.1 chemotaxis protein CheY [Pseudoalteromonas luteoviolacea H33-S]MBQ4877391.1 response regulator [Pseudoalteromonas luteoviolacea]MBQ4906510.1 response regulator [Pseudoalteromonas luteoviolacea]MCF6438307.1 response regulator [Pseudoalteromonas luteoviolacea]
MNDLLSTDLTILLVEPSVTQRKIIAKELKDEGVQNIDFADSVSSAIDALNQNLPDLIICTLYLADGDALALLDHVHEHFSEHQLPFMLVSSETRRQQLEAYKQSGVVAILPKPFTKEHLGKAINATLDLLSPQELELDLYDIQDLRILVVDDSMLARNHIQRVLQNLGATRISEAENGAQALSILNESMFDLIVTDFNMPEVNGQELTEAIRRSDEHAHVPVLMVTSEANETHLANVAQSGVNAMCDKPFEPNIVKQLIYQMLEQN